MTVFVCGIILLLLLQVSKIQLPPPRSFLGRPSGKVCCFSSCPGLPRGDSATLYPVISLLMTIVSQPESPGILKLHLYRIPGDFGIQKWNILFLGELTVLKWINHLSSLRACTVNPSTWNYRCRKKKKKYFFLLRRKKIFLFVFFFFFGPSLKFTRTHNYIQGEGKTVQIYIQSFDFNLGTALTYT